MPERRSLRPLATAVAVAPIGVNHGAATKHTPYFAVLEALRGGHCPTCHLGQRAAAAYVNELITEGINDPLTRQRTRRSRGLCRQHTWYLRRHGGVPGMFFIYRDVLQEAAATLAEVQATPRPAGLRSWLYGLLRRPLPGVAEVAARLAPRGGCPVCEQQAGREQMYTDVLLHYLQDDDVQVAFANGASLCLDHLRLAMVRARSEATLRRLLAIEGGIYGRLLTDLDELIAGPDCSRAQPGRPRAAGAGIRAVSLIAGEEALS